jgi:hypothetical protein
MKVLVGNNGNVDFDAPVRMDDATYAKFLKLLKELFEPEVVQEAPASTFRSERLGERFFQRRWDAAEYSVLLRPIELAKACEMLGRSWMSVDIKRGSFSPLFLAYAEQKGHEVFSMEHDQLLGLIEEFLNEKEIQKKVRREARLQKTRAEKEKVKLTTEKRLLGKKIAEMEKAIAEGKKSLVYDNLLPHSKKRLIELEARLSEIDEVLSEG